nr:l-arabinitol 4-dehydrogenase [Quercus suber]
MTLDSNQVTGGASLDGLDQKQVQTGTKPQGLAADDLARYGNPALHVTPDHRLELTEIPIPTPSATEALVHVRCTGICGSDMHLWHRGAIGPLVVDRTCILGHEASGVVLAVGAAVTHLNPGDRVAIEPGVPCGTCWLCSSGQYNLCEAARFAGVCPHAGTIRRFMCHEARYLHKIPPDMTFAQGALLEPLSVILHALQQCRGSLALGRPALICGAGPIGLIALAAAKASGAWPLAITDVDASRLAFARTFVPGAQTHLVSASATPLETAEAIRQQLYGVCGREATAGVPSPDESRAPATVLECTGVAASIATAAYTCRRAGLVVVIGVGHNLIDHVPFMHMSLAQIELRFTNRYADTWPAGITALRKRDGDGDGAPPPPLLDLDALVTQTFSLRDAVRAMETCADPDTHSVKVQIVDDVEIEVGR